MLSWTFLLSVQYFGCSRCEGIYIVSSVGEYLPNDKACVVFNIVQERDLKQYMDACSGILHMSNVMVCVTGFNSSQ